MNIFFLSKDSREAAEMQCDKHVVKMIVETAQLLSTAHRILDGDKLSSSLDALLYKPTHRNHPCAVWCRTSIENYNWLVDHLEGLLEEYTHRYKKIHKTARLLECLRTPPANLSSVNWTEPPSCMPEEYHVGSYVSNYREYYRKAKAHILKWTNRDPPLWITYKGIE